MGKKKPLRRVAFSSYVIGAKGGLDLAHGCAERIRAHLKDEVMMSAQAEVRRVPWRSSRERTSRPIDGWGSIYWCERGDSNPHGANPTRS